MGLASSSPKCTCRKVVTTAQSVAASYAHGCGRTGQLSGEHSVIRALGSVAAIPTACGTRPVALVRSQAASRGHRDTFVRRLSQRANRDVHNAKNRSGRVGVVELAWRAHITALAPLAKEPFGEK